MSFKQKIRRKCINHLFYIISLNYEQPLAVICLFKIIYLLSYYILPSAASAVAAITVICNVLSVLIYTYHSLVPGLVIVFFSQNVTLFKINFCYSNSAFLPPPVSFLSSFTCRRNTFEIIFPFFLKVNSE